MQNLNPKKRIELARALWGCVPHPTQKEWLLDDHPVKVAACGRRWGKTESAAVDVATYAIANDGSVQMIVAPTYDQSRLISNGVERLLMARADIRRHARITRTPYPNLRVRHSRIMARTADDDGRNLRGHSADRVIVDEAAFVRDVVIEEVIGPMLADRNGRLMMISTPFGKNHFYRAFLEGCGKGDEARSQSRRFRSFRFPSWSNPHISSEYIEHQRAVITERQFRTEYEAEFVDDQSSVFPWSDIEAACRKPDGSSTHQICETVAGVDWARYSDYTAVVVVGIVERNPCVSSASPSYHVLAVDRFNRMQWRAQVERAADLLCRFRVRLVAADQTSVGDPLLEMLKHVVWNERGLDARIEGVVFTSQTKREMIDNLAIKLAQRDLSLPPRSPLVKELQAYEYELTDSGNVRTGARRGCHDDCVCALALALRAAPSRTRVDGFRSSGTMCASARGW